MRSPQSRLANRSDQQTLSAFTCAPAGPRYPNTGHPEPWALEVQNWARGDALRDQRRHARQFDPRVLLYHDPDTNDLIAVSGHMKVSQDETVRGRLIMAFAVALHLRGVVLTDTGQRLSDTVLNETLRDIRASEPGPVEAWGRVHPDNKASERTLRRNGFTSSDQPKSDGYFYFARMLA